MIPLIEQIEGLLFFSVEPLEYKEIGKLLKAKESEVREAVAVLKERNTFRGVVLLEKENTVTLGTHPELSGVLEDIRKEELNKELTRASLETLSIILYKNGAARSEIDYIRGVNSSFILRNLMIRGLIEKKVHPSDSRKILYMPTFDAQNYLGVTAIKDIPEFEKYNELLSQSLAPTPEAGEVKEE